MEVCTVLNDASRPVVDEHHLLDSDNNYIHCEHNIQNGRVLCEYQQASNVLYAQVFRMQFTLHFTLICCADSVNQYGCGYWS